MARTTRPDPDDGEVLPPSRRVTACPIVKTSVMWPYPIDFRLNELADALSRTALGEVTRSHLLAAIVAHIGNDQAALTDLVAQYRESTVSSITRTRQSLVVRQRTPGRRPHTTR